MPPSHRRELRHTGKAKHTARNCTPPSVSLTRGAPETPKLMTATSPPETPWVRVEQCCPCLPTAQDVTTSPLPHTLLAEAL